jgi:hypothetical protein
VNLKRTNLCCILDLSKYYFIFTKESHYLHTLNVHNTQLFWGMGSVNALIDSDLDNYATTTVILALPDSL